MLFSCLSDVWFSVPGWAAGNPFWLSVFMQVQDIEDTPPCSRGFSFFFFLLRGFSEQPYPAVLEKGGRLYVAFSGTAQKRYFLELLEVEL